MELHQLEYVLAVAKYQNFTRAAEEIKTSQSSLSQQIGKLENELGVSLFVRTTRSVQLTPAGEEFILHAKKILSAVNDTRRSIHEYTTIVKGNLALGIHPIIGYYRLPNLLASFQKNYPGVKISFVEEQCDELLDMLHSSKIDAAIIQHAVPSNEFQFFPLISDQMVVVVSDRHPLAHRDSVELKELQDENFIVPPQVSGHFADFIQACRVEGFEPRVLLTCTHVRTIMGLVREELGITAFSSYVAALDIDPSLKILSLSPTINRKIYLAVKATTDVPPTLKVFVKFALQWVNNNITKSLPFPDK
ncbi:MAG: LysR family transcriptional regulator [Clostridia bacterium]|jgi:DNA-binding transcriptional LysR family regulator|nr:LysR family transcriptional regulator [Clostridia bacterium]